MNSSQPSDRTVSKHLDKILFGVASLYLLAVLGWVAYRSLNQKAQVSPKPTISAADSQFIAYLQQSLNLLAQEETTQKTLVNPSENNLSTVTVAPSPTPEKVIERIYVPMYPQAATPSASAPEPPPSPSPKLNNIPAPPPLPSKTSPPSSVPVLTPGQSTFSVPSQVAANSSLPQTGSHTLVGVLEAGQASSAIFTFDGITRRFEIGEAIGSSGSVLMGVQNQKAVVYHNGKTNYVEVGQGF